MPVYVWALLILVGAINEIVRASKWTEALSIWQGVWRFILWIPALGPLLTRFPFLGPFIQKLAGVDPDAGKLPLPVPAGNTDDGGPK